MTPEATAQEGNGHAQRFRGRRSLAERVQALESGYERLESALGAASRVEGLTARLEVEVNKVEVLKGELGAYPKLLAHQGQELEKCLDAVAAAKDLAADVRDGLLALYREVKHEIPSVDAPIIERWMRLERVRRNGNHKVVR